MNSDPSAGQVTTSCFPKLRTTRSKCEEAEYKILMEPYSYQTEQRRLSLNVQSGCIIRQATATHSTSSGTGLHNGLLFESPSPQVSRSLVWKPQPLPGSPFQGEIKFLHLFQVQLSHLCDHHWTSLFWAAMISWRNPIFNHHGRSPSDNKMVFQRNQPSHRHGYCLSPFWRPNYSETRP